ncbi:MAG: tol-pal system-associated acyl-CoA thioesterase [Caldimonas sp.]
MTPEQSPQGIDHAAEFRLPIRIYWEDTDAAGIVFYANYLKFFERARTEWLRSFGLAQERLRAESGVAFVVTDTSLRYLVPARLDDIIEVSVHIERLGQASLVVTQQARRDDQLLAEGTIRVGCVDLGTFRPRRIPDDILMKILQEDSTR